MDHFEQELISESYDVEWRHDHNFKPLFQKRGKDDQNIYIFVKGKIFNN